VPVAHPRTSPPPDQTRGAAYHDCHYSPELVAEGGLLAPLAPEGGHFDGSVVDFLSIVQFGHNAHIGHAVFGFEEEVKSGIFFPNLDGIGLNVDFLVFTEVGAGAYHLSVEIFLVVGADSSVLHHFAVDALDGLKGDVGLVVSYEIVFEEALSAGESQLRFAFLLAVD
jgi:hypothetical protein